MADPNAIQPAMRKIVAWLQEIGFHTTDSGDGVTNIEAGIEGALPFPYVRMGVEPAVDLWDERGRLSLLCQVEGLFKAPPSAKGWGPPEIQALYSPLDKTSILMLINVDDDVWLSR